MLSGVAGKWEISLQSAGLDVNNPEQQFYDPRCRRRRRAESMSQQLQVTRSPEQVRP